MDKRKSILNVSVSVGFKLLTVVMVILVKRFLIEACGNEVNGLNALYLSIIGFLSVAELGVGSAITFCMYKPIVDGDEKKVSALYHLFRRLYLLIGAFILLSGLVITPFVRYFAKDYAQLDVNFYTTFVLMLISVVLTYAFGAKTALINAYKNNYITTAITSGGLLLQYILQIAIVLLTRSFACYLLCRIVAALMQWIATDYIAKKRYRSIMADKQRIDKEQKTQLVRNIKAMLMHNIGTFLVNTADSIVISLFVGVAALGLYSNYAMVLTSMTGILKMVFTSLTSVVGHLYVQSAKRTVSRYCEAFHLLNFCIATVFFLGYYAVIDSFIALAFSETLIVSDSLALCITFNGFVQFMRQGVLVFREATGTFYNDRWKPLFEGIMNVVLSILFVKWIGIPGIILATILTNLLICHVVEPFVLYKNAFGEKPIRYYLYNYTLIAVFALALYLVHCLQTCTSSPVVSLLQNGVMSLAISIPVCLVAIVMRRELCGIVLKKIKRR